MEFTLISPYQQSELNFARFKCMSLNPNAPEFYPTTYLTLSATTAAYTTTTYHILGYTCPNNNVFPPPFIRLPHHHSQHPYFTDHHLVSPVNYQTNLGSPMPMQSVSQLQARKPISLPMLQDRQAASAAANVDVGVARKGGVVCRRSCEGKNGFKKKNKIDDARVQGRGILGNKDLRERKESSAVKPDGVETTAMIRNVPNQYTLPMLIKFLDDFCKRENEEVKDSVADDEHPPLAFDFLYLPIDFRSGANKGYAFVNFTHPIAVWKLHLACNDQSWEHCCSPKKCQIAYATLQGKKKLMAHFGLSKFCCNDKGYLPVCFSPPRDGTSVPVTETRVGHFIGKSSHLTN